MAENTESENEDKLTSDPFYLNAKKYWANVTPTVDGMLGGFAKISPTDINGSKAFLRPFLKVKIWETSGTGSEIQIH